jgi:hypothetical protein
MDEKLEIPLWLSRRMHMAMKAIGQEDNHA